MDKLIFTGEEGDTIELYPVESTKIAGVNYLLAADAETGDGSCYILRERSDDRDETAAYEMVDDEDELDYLLSVFAELLDDIDLDG